MKKLVIKGNYLAFDDGTPFFYLGDTAWEAAHRFTRDEVVTYLDARARQGFTAVQVVALAEFEGLTVPNMTGRLPLLFTDGLPDPTRPDTEGEYSYWDNLDYIVDEAAKRGIFVTLLPTWGDKFNQLWGKGPVVFDPENARVYGEWIASRYASRWNIIWMLGGDRPLEPVHREIIDAMAAGIKSADTEHLITFHPTGDSTSVGPVGDAEYIDINSAQTGHGIEGYKSDEVMRAMCAAGKPYFDSEPRYEDHPACFDDTLGYYWNADDVRQNAYWDVFAGTCGHTYGDHAIWSVTREPTSYYPVDWATALTHPGAEQIGFVRVLRMSRDFFSFRPAPELLTTSYAGMGHLAAARGADYAFAYSPLGLPFGMNYDFIGAKQVKASWFDPRTGKETLFAILPSRFASEFAPPSSGKGCDWVLVLDAVR